MFSITQLIEHLTTELTASEVVRITPDAALDAQTSIRWVIVPTGELPISDDAFPALSGVLDFSAGADQPQTLSLTPGEVKHGFARDFEIRFYQVVGARDDDSAEEDDILLSRFSFDIAGKDDIAYRDVSRVSGSDKNVITFGTTSDVSASGAANDDRLIISKYQYGDVTIDDGQGINLIQFDAGVAITGFEETSVRNGNVVREVSLTLSTGAKIIIKTPLGISNTFQFGDDEVLADYEALKAFLFASDDDSFVTNTEISFTTPFVVATDTPAPVLSDPRIGREIDSNGGSDDDILEAGTDYDVQLSGAAGDDILVVTRFQYGDVTIDDGQGINRIKFDAGVGITGFEETSVRRGSVVREVSLTLSTGAKIIIKTPLGISNTFQFGDDDVLADYEALKDFLFASDDDTFATNTEITFATPFVIAKPDANEVPVFDQASYTATVAENIAENEIIATISATDADAGDTLTYSITAGDDDGLFAIDGATGVITLAAGKSLDYETATNHILTVEVSDGTNTNTSQVTITVTDIIEIVPVFTLATGSAAGDMLDISTDGKSVNPYPLGVTFTIDPADAIYKSFTVKVNGIVSQDYGVEQIGNVWTLVYKGDGYDADIALNEDPILALSITASIGTDAQSAVDVELAQDINIQLHDGKYIKWNGLEDGSFGFNVYNTSDDQIITEDALLNGNDFAYSNMIYLDASWSSDPANPKSTPPSELTLGGGRDIYIISNGIAANVHITDPTSGSGADLLKNLIRFEDGVEVVAQAEEQFTLGTLTGAVTNILTLDTDGDTATTDDRVELKIIGETFDFQIGHGDIMTFDEMIGQFLPEV